MRGVVTRNTSGEGKQGKEQEELWKSTHTAFSVSMTDVRNTRKWILSRASEIAAENLSGQCTKGHSCKEEAKAGLENLIQNGVKI